jgi:predicted DCC family thiol-disulfide oxidoreductase YuxK
LVLTGYFTLLSQSAWALLIVLPCFVWLKVLPASVPGNVKRALLLAGLFVHTGIVLLMDVGTFTFTVFASYLGLLLDEDFRAIRHRLNGDSRPPEVVLFDGRCGFCKGSVVVLKSFDWLHRLEFVNFHDPKVRETYVPTVSLDALKTAMHVKSSNGNVTRGFKAFRALAWHLPPTWILVPLLYIPGIPTVGDWAYQWIADHRI